MIIGLVGPTNAFDPRREKIAAAYSKKVFYFGDLSAQFARSFGLTHRGRTWEELTEKEDVASLVHLQQQVEDGIRRVNPKIYLDWMGNQLATTVFSRGLRIQAKVVEAVIADVKYEEQARWVRNFGVDRVGCRNKLVLVPGAQLPVSLGLHRGENEWRGMAPEEVWSGKPKC